MWGPQRQQGDHRAYGGVGTMWGQQGRCWDDMGMTGTMLGQQITKNAITLEQIKIIKFHLKIWDL